MLRGLCNFHQFLLQVGRLVSSETNVSLLFVLTHPLEFGALCDQYAYSLT
jgi:hypothetical protein